VNFHDILAAANPNPFLRFSCELINEMIRQLIEFRNDTPPAELERFGQANVKIHKAISKAARERDAEKVRELMVIHMTEAPRYVKRMKGKLRGRLILDAEIRKRAKIEPSAGS
jgi:GntR family transcriptional repressor for pyruvate dehydrogenase complex